MRIENVRYNAVTSDVKKPGFIYKEWFHNGLTTDLKHTFKKQTEFSDTYTWSVTDTIAIGEKISFSLGLPGEFGVSAEASATFTASNTESQTETKTETFSSEVAIMVTPKTSVKVLTITKLFRVHRLRLSTLLAYNLKLSLSGLKTTTYNEAHGLRVQTYRWTNFFKKAITVWKGKITYSPKHIPYRNDRSCWLFEINVTFLLLWSL